MQDCVVIPIQPVGKVNCVVMSFSHDKRRKALCQSFYPGERSDDGRLLVHITNGQYVMGQEMKRDNRKLLLGLRDHARECAANKDWHPLETVAQTVKAMGFELV